MTALGRQLEQARDRHRAATYPGDLAADVLHEAARRARWRIAPRSAIAAAALIAACAALVVYLHQPSTPTPAPQAVAAELNFAVPAKPDMPRDLPVVPAHQQLTSIPAKPEFPSIYQSL